MTHNMKKFRVPEYIVELLEGLPFMIGFSICGDVLAIEDTFSLMVGQDLGGSPDSLNWVFFSCMPAGCFPAAICRWHTLSSPGLSR